ncbi:hypothetical protein D3C77_752210 [compost metagenome]
MARFGFSLLDVGQDRNTAVIEAMPHIGDDQAAGGTLNQPGIQAFFQHRDGA